MRAGWTLPGRELGLVGGQDAHQLLPHPVVEGGVVMCRASDHVLHIINKMQRESTQGAKWQQNCSNCMGVAYARYSMFPVRTLVHVLHITSL
jgi:hypothetical protein